MKNVEDAKKLANLMIKIGKAYITTVINENIKETFEIEIDHNGKPKIDEEFSEMCSCSRYDVWYHIVCKRGSWCG